MHPRLGKISHKKKKHLENNWGNLDTNCIDDSLFNGGYFSGQWQCVGECPFWKAACWGISKGKDTMAVASFQLDWQKRNVFIERERD